MHCLRRHRLSLLRGSIVVHRLLGLGVGTELLENGLKDADVLRRCAGREDDYKLGALPTSVGPRRVPIFDVKRKTELPKPEHLRGAEQAPVD